MRPFKNSTDGVKLKVFKKPIQKIFEDKSLTIFLAVVLILRFIWAFSVPLGADEAYYYDWSKNIHLSYYDHPPGVSWTAYLGQFIFGESIFAARFFSIVIHFLTMLVMINALEVLKPAYDRRDLRNFVGIATLVPILSIGSFFIMPDIGLIFFLSILYLKVLKIYNLPKLTIKDALICGILWGMAFNFKYHALAVGGGAVFSLFLLRLKKVPREYNFWLVLTVTPFLAAFPVFYWNYLNDWISFRFQTGHGFAEPSFNAQNGLRTLLMQFILLTPLLLVLYAKSLALIKSSGALFITFFTAMPLGILLFVLAFFKPVLPHWIIPAIWMATPFICTKLIAIPNKLVRFNFLFGAFIAVSIPTIFSLEMTKVALFNAMDNRPGSLAELTVWDYVKDDSLVQEKIADLKDMQCPLSLASFRWFSTAQIAARFPGKKTYNLSSKKTSYYTFRDKNFPEKGCPVLILGPSKHADFEAITSKIDVLESFTVTPKYHEDSKFYLGVGQWK